MRYHSSAYPFYLPALAFLLIIVAGSCRTTEAVNVIPEALPLSLELEPGAVLEGFVSGPGAASPGVAVSGIRGGEPVYRSVAGARRSGAPEPVAPDDAFHLGSNTKAMTAALCGLLVDRGLLSWDSTVGEVLGAEAEPRAEYLDATLSQLLSHTAGFPAELPARAWASFFPYDSAKGGERARMAREALKARPSSTPGSAFLYSNLGYVVAGRMAEVVTGKDWESLLREELFASLGMGGADFGPPAKGRPGPWGHTPKPLDPASFNADNPAALGPAGTVHASLSDLERYVTLYFDPGVTTGLGATAPRLLSEATRAELMRPRLEGYGLGWAVIEQEGRRFLYHDGCNTSFYSSIVIFPATGDAVIVLANQGDDAAGVAVGRLVEYLAGRFLVPRRAEGGKE